MKGINKITIYALIMSVLGFSCNDFSKEQAKKKDDFVIKAEFRKYGHYIEDAMFKVYLKMGIQKVAVIDTIQRRDSMFLGEMKLVAVGCRELNVPDYKGLLIDFVFVYNDSTVYFSNSPSFVSSVFYRGMSIQDWFFAYGELNIINYDQPNQIDTLRVLQYIDKGGTLNPWFKKRMQDSLRK